MPLKSVISGLSLLSKNLENAISQNGKSEKYFYAPFLIHMQGRRNGGAEGANAPSIFGKLQQLSQILGEIEKFAAIAGFETIMHRQF